MAIYSKFSHWTWWFSIVILCYVGLPAGISENGYIISGIEIRKGGDSPAPLQGDLVADMMVYSSYASCFFGDQNPLYVYIVRMLINQPT